MFRLSFFLIIGLLIFTSCEDKNENNDEHNIVNENKLLLKWIGVPYDGCYGSLYYIINPNNLDLCNPTYSYDCDKIILHLDVKMGTDNNYNLLTYTLKSKTSVNLSTTIYLPNYEWEELNN